MREIGDGLRLRWATDADVEALADFNFQIHNDNPGGVPETWLRDWTRSLADGGHPTTGVEDFTLVEDGHQGNRIVSTLVLIAQTWRYGRQPFGCGRVELVATHPDYRRRGLVRAQMDLIHERSAERGHLLQAITGIPWFYRRFGYEMALELSGGRRITLANIPVLTGGQDEAYRLRPTTIDDIPFLTRLYEADCTRSLISCQRTPEVWHHELTNPELGNLRCLHVIEQLDGSAVGYVDLAGQVHLNAVRELVVDQGVSMRAVGLFVVRWLRARLQEQDGTGATVTELFLRLGSEHPLYEALRPELGRRDRPYAWYIRIADLKAFLMHIRSELEDRLARSPLAGYSGSLRLNLYTSWLEMEFVAGRLCRVGDYQPAHNFDNDISFPDLSFIQLLLGYRSFEEIAHIRPDCYAERDEAIVLLSALFPKHYSRVVAVT